MMIIIVLIIKGILLNEAKMFSKDVPLLSSRHLK